MKNFASKPEWLTFDCYGTLIQWDEGLVAAVEGILTRSGARDVSSDRLIRLYDRKEHDLECERPHLPFRAVAGPVLDLQAARDLGFRCIWIDRGTGRVPLRDYTPDAIFDKLDRVPVLFKQLGWS
jgi:FMN phosphatase YigB (HAD superfamily)